MIHTNYKVSFRRLIKSKFYSIASLMSLALGIASTVIIYQFVVKESSFDAFHSKIDRISHLTRVVHRDNGDVRSLGVPAPLIHSIKDRYPEVEITSQYFFTGGIKVRIDSLNSAKEEMALNSIAIDGNFLNVFDFELAYGKYLNFNNSIGRVLITESRANALFGEDIDPVGRTIWDNRNRALIIDGVLKDLRPNSSLKFDLVYSLDHVYPKDSNIGYIRNLWQDGGFQQAFVFNSQMTKERSADILNDIKEIYLQNMRPLDHDVSFEFADFSKAHFAIDVSDNFVEKYDYSYLLVLSAIGLFILVASLANYIALSLAQSFEKSKEIGIRRTMGALKTHIIKIYFLESFIITTSAFLFGLVLVELSIPKLEFLINRTLAIKGSSQFMTLQMLYFLFLSAGFASVIYPAFKASRKTVLGKNVIGSANPYNKSSILYIINAGQAGIFIFLIAAAFFVNKQFIFLQNEDLGFNKQNIIIINTNTKETIFKKEELKDAFRKSPYVSDQSIAVRWPSARTRSKYAQKEELDFIEYLVEPDYLDVFGIDIIKGRGFNDFPHQGNYTIINETTVEALGFDEPIGKMFNGKEIIGIVGDFHAESKREKIKPIALVTFQNGAFGMLTLKYIGDNRVAVVNDLRDRFETVTGSSNMDLTFFDQVYDRIYSKEKTIHSLIQLFTFISLLISVIGIVGNNAYAIKRRMKELSIRKVLGANALDMFSHINFKMLAFLFVAILIAVPISYLWISDWLNQFSYSIELDATGYLLVVLMVIGFIVPVMFLQVIRAYLINPVEILKDE